MSTGFAGSRSMDERRRRRIASESSESLDDSNDDSTSVLNTRTNRFAAGQYPLRTLIFPKRWKLTLYYLPVFLCFSGLIAIDFYRLELCAPESTLSAYLSLEQSPLPLVLTGCLLFFSGQIALLIASLRTQSLHDFSGRYRLWKFVAGGLFLFALCTTTQLHQVWAATVIELNLFDWGPHTELLAWLIPSLVVGFSVSSMSYLEMRGDRAGLNFTILAAATYMIYLTFMLTGNMIPWESHHTLIGAGILYFAHWSLFTSLLLHTHHLLYRSVDLPEKVPSRFTKHFANHIRRRRIKKKAKRIAKTIKQKELVAIKLAQKEIAEQEIAEKEKVKLEKAKQEKSQQETEEAINESKTTVANSKSTQRAAKKKKTPPATPAKPQGSIPQTASTPEPDEEWDTPQQQSAPKSKMIMRVDNAHDPEMLKGLSKRERRKLQKQWREEERLNAQQNQEDYS